jgi:aspartate aminotransferase
LAPTYKMTEAFKQRRDYVIGALKKIPGIEINVPHGAFYAFPEVSSFFGKSNGDTVIRNDEDFSMYLLDKAHVATVCGSAFGNGRYIRISFAASMTNLRDAMERITAALGELH